MLKRINDNIDRRFFDLNQKLNKIERKIDDFIYQYKKNERRR